MVKPREEFLGLLNVAQQNAQIVAEVLASRGYHVRILPHSISPNVEERWKHTDEGDLEITQRVELKHWPNIDFKSLDEVPYDNVIVDEAYKIDKEHRTTLYAYLILNASVTGYLLIPIWTRRYWFKKELHDGREDSERTYYMCAKRFLAFYWLGDPPPPIIERVVERVVSRCAKHGEYDGDGNCEQCELERMG